MIIKIRVKANSKVESVKKTNEREYCLRVKAQPHEGKANKAVIKLLSEFFDIPKSMVIILKGDTNKNKIIELLLRED